MNTTRRMMYVSKKSKRRKRTIKQQQKCIDRLKMDIRKAMGLEYKPLPDDVVWDRAIYILKEKCQN